MDSKFKKAIAHVSCGGNFGTAFLISSIRAVTAYHVVERFIEGHDITLEFTFPYKKGNRIAQLINARNHNDERDLAILEFSEPIEEIEPLQLTAKQLIFGDPWIAIGYPTVKDSTSQIFVGDVAQFVVQHISKYDLDLYCTKPTITDPKFKLGGASGSPIIVEDEVVALISDKLPGGTLGAVSIKCVRDLLAMHKIDFKDRINEITESTENEYRKMLEMYSIKINYFLEKNMIVPFYSEINGDLIKDNIFNIFFEKSTWKSKIIDHVSFLSREFRNDPLERERGFIRKLQDLCDKYLSYEEFKLSMIKLLDSILREIPEDRSTRSLSPLLIEFYSLLNNRFNKVLIITGESGTGKTHVLRTILSTYQIEMGLEHFSIRIPIEVNNIKEVGVRNAVINNLNNYFNSNFEYISDMHSFVIDLEKKGIIFKITFVIDDLHVLINSSAKHYIDLKQIIMNYTQFDWINWCFSLNELDLYLILENNGFLESYCVSNKYDNDALNLFVNMNQLNEEKQVCYQILTDNGIDTEAIKRFPKNANNIQMLLKNPLISHVYASTVNEDELELHNICYFNFIKRYTDIKKKQMMKCSERDISVVEQEVQIDNDIEQIVKSIIRKEKLTYLEKESVPLFQGFEDCYFELRSVHLISKKIVEIEDLFERRKEIFIKFDFNLYWAYKIILDFRKSNNWSEFSKWRSSFKDLKNELLIYEFLYLDTDYEKNIETLSNEISHVLNSEDEKGLLFFVAVKTSFTCQGIIFNNVLEKEDMVLNKQETFGLLYFLMHTNTKIHQKFAILSRHLNEISKYELESYLESVCKKLFSKLESPPAIKKCVSELISCEDARINRTIGKIAAENFVRILEDQLQNDIEKIIDEHLVTFLCNHVDPIKSSLPEDHKNPSFIECFLRSLFRLLIEKNESNRFYLHEILLGENYYFMEKGNEKHKPNEINKTVSHLLRSSSAVVYGSLYKYLHHSKKRNFKEQYIKYITNLLESGFAGQRILAYHFISNTLFDFEDPREIVDIEFIPFLHTIYEDQRLIKFCRIRRHFFERNINAYA